MHVQNEYTNEGMHGDFFNEKMNHKICTPKIFIRRNACGKMLAKKCPTKKCGTKKCHGIFLLAKLDLGQAGGVVLSIT